MTSRKLRWGILGAANIARKNWKAIRLAGNSTVTAVASRSLDRAREFIAACEAEVPMDAPPRAFGSYESLLESDAVEAVYIPLPTGLRKPLVLQAARAGKHVLCEKPCAGSVADLREMLEACRGAGVQFADGVMFMHSRRLEALRQVLEDGTTVGAVRHVASAFTFRETGDWFDTNIRTHSALEPAGCLGDLGWYCLRFALWERHWELPRVVTGRIITEHRRPDSPAPVPTAFSGELVFAGGVTSSFYCSFLTETEQWVRILGTHGSVMIPDFVLPFAGETVGFDVHRADFDVRGCDFRMTGKSRRITVPEHSHGHATAQETRLFRSFAEAALAGRPDSGWPDEALKTQMVMEAALASARAGGRAVPATGIPPA